LLACVDTQILRQSCSSPAGTLIWRDHLLYRNQTC